jgi:hypothetical protein
MPQTPPFTGLVPRKLTDSELARAIRLNLEAEFDAINLYASHIDATDNADAKAVIRHVMDEEKEHAALFWELIKRLDPSQAKHDAEAKRKVDLLVAGASDEEIEAVGEEDGEEADETPMPKRFTVGGLKKG